MKRIHIVGSGPRTGTTLLTEAMATCFDIDHRCAHEASIATDQPTHGNCFLTKKPGEISAVGLPLKLNPDLYVICMIRDPRDSIVSVHGSAPHRYYDGLRHWMLFVTHYPRLARNPRFLTVRYEDFARDPDRTQRYLKEHLPFLKATHPFSEYHLHCDPGSKSLEALKTLRPITPEGIGSWRKHLPRVKQQLQLHGDISDSLIRFGYEADANWLDQLEAAQAVDYRQVKDEYFPCSLLMKRRKDALAEVANIIARKLGLDPSVVFRPFHYAFRMTRKVTKDLLKLFR